MANTKSYGFKPFSRGGAMPEVRRGRVLTNNTRRIALWDALDAQSGGDLIAHATAAGAVYSVAMGVSYVDASTGLRLDRLALPAATLYTSSGIDPSNASYVYFIEDLVNTRFRVSVDAAIALTDLNLNYQMVVTEATGDRSLHELDDASRATTETAGGWRVDAFNFGNLKNDTSLADAEVICSVNMGRRNPALDATEGTAGT